MLAAAAFALCLAWPVASSGAPIRLISPDGVLLQIDPATLEAALTESGGEPVPLSTGIPGLGSVRAVTSEAGQASWRLPDAGLSVRVRLRKGRAHVTFRGAGRSMLSWPVTPATHGVRGFIVPAFEGVYVRSDDSRLAKWLTDQGAMSATADLSMPFLGLDLGDETVTYLLPVPYYVSLSFHESTPPKATFTHTWTRKRPNADYAVVIETGDAATLTPALVYRRWLAEHGQLVTLKQKIAANANVQRLLGAPHAYLWGDGVSVAMLDTIHRSGIDRFVLCTGDLDFASLKPEVAARAAELGYLFGPYDSYDSVHSPDADPDDTWTTAQFDRKLYETGRVIGADGEARRGFKGVGYRLSPLAAKPYVRRRVEERLAKVPYSAWFVDCDAFGEFLEDYSPEHPATRIDDARARRQRLRWLSEEHGLVVGSEGGTAVMTAAIHFGHGVMTPVIGWGDERLTSRDSEYFLGAWWPPDAPGVFFKRVPLCPDYARPYFDPRDRLPLYQAVFGDCVIATHHWTAASLKFADQLGTVELLELLYNVPPLYHLNREQWLRDEARIVRHFAFWSPIHRALALAPLVGFEHLTPDRLVQRTTFAADAGRVHLIANFDRVERTLANGQCLPPRSLTVTGALRLDQPVFVVGD